MISGTRMRLVTLLNLSPCMPASRARASAVLPLESFTTVPSPLEAASRWGRTMFQAGLSLTDPNGSSISSLAYRSMLRSPCTAGSMRTSGVLPMASVMLSYLIRMFPPIDAIGQ